MQQNAAKKKQKKMALLEAQPALATSRAPLPAMGKKFVKSFLVQNTMHGQMFLAQRQLTCIEKCFWLLTLCTAIAFSIQVSIGVVQRYFNENTMISLAFDYYRNITLPSATVCPRIQLDSALYEAYMAGQPEIAAERRLEFFRFLEMLANANYRNMHELPAPSAAIDETLALLHITSEQYMPLIYNLTVDRTVRSPDDDDVWQPKFGYITTMDSYVTVCTRQVLTEHGLCYMTNSFLDQRYTSAYAIAGTLPPRRKCPERIETEFFMSYATYIINGMPTQFAAYITSPYDTFFLERNAFLIKDRAQIFFKKTDFVTEQHLERSTTVAQRRCRFHHESNLTHFPMYTRNLCLQECRLNMVYELCACIPHFYPNRIVQPKTVCSYKDLRNCVSRHAENLIKLRELIDGNKDNKTNQRACNCLPNCRDSSISVTNLVEMPVDAFSGSKSLEITMEKNLPMLYVRRVIYTFSDVLVSIGGTVGLYLGFSVMGAIEIVYFLTLRLFWYTRGYQG